MRTRDLDVALAGEVALAECTPAPSRSVGGSVDEELALDLHAHVPSMVTGRYRSAHMGTVRAGWGAQADAGRRWLPHFAAAGFDVEPPVAVTSTVLDTFDGRLHAAGLRLDHDGDTLLLDGRTRCRRASRSPSRPGSPPTSRPGRSAPGSSTSSRCAPCCPWPRSPASSAAPCSRNGDGKVVASVRTYEQISHRSGRVDGWLVAVDELTGYEKQAAADHARWSPSTGIALTDGDDAIALMLRAAGVDLTGHHVEPGVPLEPDLPAIEGFRLVLANLHGGRRRQPAGHDRRHRREFLHDLRVAVRRSRSVLRHGKRVLPADVAGVGHPDLKHLGDITGPPRDLDVLVVEWDGYVAALPDDAAAALEPLRPQLDDDRAAAHRQLAADLASPNASSTCSTAGGRGWPTGAGTPGPRGERPLVDVVVRRIHKAQRRLHRPRPGDHPRHAGRGGPRGAQGRQEAALPAGVLRQPAADGRAQGVRQAAQGAAGQPRRAPGRRGPRRQAAPIAGELPATTPAATFVAVGQLVEQLERRRTAARDEFAERFAEFDSKPTRRALRAMLDGVGR